MHRLARNEKPSQRLVEVVLRNGKVIAVTLLVISIIAVTKPSLGLIILFTLVVLVNLFQVDALKLFGLGLILMAIWLALFTSDFIHAKSLMPSGLAGNFQGWPYYLFFLGLTRLLFTETRPKRSTAGQLSRNQRIYGRSK